MNYVLLIGAGFSRNWGGWLAAEAFEYLLGCPQVDVGLRNLLWMHRLRGGFEDALAELQGEYLRRRDAISHQHLKKLQDAISDMFSDMDKAFSSIPEFEFNKEASFSVRAFLLQFDAIFTLNQDLLLERHYLANRGPLGRWSGTYIPGVRPIKKDVRQLTEVYTDRWSPHPSEPDIHATKQPFFKLHGSSNWFDADGQQLLVMGGNKADAIQRHPILAWNHKQFRTYLAQSPTRLMIIGYGFRDDHINHTIIEAAKGERLEIFIIDPYGLDVIDEHRHHMMYTPGPLVSALKHRVVGASRRSLGEIFRGDSVERSKLMRFFA